MGITNSKFERSNALKLCKERILFIKQAIDSRYALAAAHVSYIQSLRNIGIALRRYAEAEVLIETSLSTSATELDKTPSHSSYPSPSPSHLGGVSDSPISPSTGRISYMWSSGAPALTVKLNLNSRNVNLKESEFSMPPPPPPPPHESGSSWDYFDPADESFRFVGEKGSNRNMDDDDDGDVRMYRYFRKKDIDLNGNDGGNDDEGPVTPKMRIPKNRNDKLVVNGVNAGKEEKSENNSEKVVQSSLRKNKSLVEKDICAEREDPSEYITHRAKDFLSSIKDIDNRFFKASESGKEVSRMLESSKIHVGYVEARGASSASICLPTFGGACCQGGSINVSDEQPVTKIITWKRMASSKSSSSRNPLATRDDNSDSGSDFIDEFCMISGSHSSTLDRLYAWERKLYDEVKASESIQKEYDSKCDQLRNQFAKDLSPQVIDRTRAAVKDIHSRMRVALHSVDTISKRIEKMRDEELLPQLLELNHGITRMWKAMLECHHSQYITISLAYHAKGTTVAPPGETQRQIINHLQDEVEYFGLSFANWINSYTSFIESLNSWLQNCILQPRECHKGRRAFSPRRYLAPPIFVLCREWSAGIKSLPSQEVSDAVKGFLSDLRRSVREQVELRKVEENVDLKNDEAESKGQDGGGSNMGCTQASLTRVLDRLTKFSEGSVKVCEDILQKSELAGNAYDNYKAPRSFSI